LLALIYTVDDTYMRQQAAADASLTNIVFILDGQAIQDTTRTAFIRFLNPEFFGADEAWSCQIGKIFAPGTLTVGTHQLTAYIIDPVFGDFETSITFYVDAAGTGACL